VSFEDALWEYISEPDTLDAAAAEHLATCARCAAAVEMGSAACGVLRATMPSIRTPGLHVHALAGG